MDLVKIGFLIQTSGLEKANKEVDSLLDKTGKIGTVSKKSATEVEASQKKAKKATEETTKAVEKNTKAVEKGNKEADKAKKAAERTTQALEKQKIVGEYLAKGLDKSTATSLANFRQLKASVIDTNTMFTLLGNNSALNKANKQTRAINDSLNKMKLNLDLVGKGFSASEQAQIRQLKANGASNAELEKAIELIKKRKQAEVLANYQNEKASLSREWMSAYDKEIEARVAKEKEAASKIQQVRDTVSDYEARSKRSFGGGILDQVEAENKEILALRKKYTDEINAIADKESAESEARRTKEMQARQKEYQQNMELLERERNKVKQANAERERTLLIEEKRSQYVEQGYGKGDAKKLATLDVAGVDPDYLERYKKSLAATTTALGSFSDASTKASASHSGLTSQIRGIAFYAVLSTAIYGAMTAMMNLASATVRMADEYTAIQNRMKLYITDANTLATVNKNLGKMAMENNVGLRETATLYARLAPAIQKIGGNAATVTAVVDAFGKSMRIGGATAMEAASATIQFSQAMASGKLAGDEFRSISEASPRFLKAIADGSGIATESLKKLSSEGFLTTALVARALLKEYPTLIEENKKLGVTLEQGVNAFKTSFLMTVGELNEGAKVTESIGNALMGVAQSLSEFAQTASATGARVRETFEKYLPVIKAVGEVLRFVAVVAVTKFAASMVVAGAAAVGSMIKATASVVGLTRTLGLANVAAMTLSTTMARLGGGGLATLALTVAGVAASYLLFRDNAAEANAKLAESNEYAEMTTEAFRKLNAEKQKNALFDLESKAVEANKNVAKSYKDVIGVMRDYYREMNRGILMHKNAPAVANIIRQVEAGTMSFETATRKLAELKVPDSVVKSMRSTTEVYIDAAKAANQIIVPAQKFGSSVKLAGNEAQNASPAIQGMTNAVDGLAAASLNAENSFATMVEGFKQGAADIKTTLKVMQSYNLEEGLAERLVKESRGAAKQNPAIVNAYSIIGKEHEAALRKLGDNPDKKKVDALNKKYSDLKKSVENSENRIAESYMRNAAPAAQELQAITKQKDEFASSRSKQSSSGSSSSAETNDYPEQLMYARKYLDLIRQGIDVDVAKIAATKEYAKWYGTNLDMAKQMAAVEKERANIEKQIQEAEQARATKDQGLRDVVKDLEQMKTISKFIAEGFIPNVANKAAGLGFTTNAEGILYAQKATTLALEEQVGALRDSAIEKRNLFELTKSGRTVEEAQLDNMLYTNKHLLPEQLTLLKQIKEINNLDRRAETMLKVSGDANAMLREAANYVAMQDNSLGEIANSYDKINKSEVNHLNTWKEIVQAVKDYNDHLVNQKANPLGDFSGINFDVFGDFGNPFKSALDGLNLLLGGADALKEKYGQYYATLDQQMKEAAGNQDTLNRIEMTRESLKSKQIIDQGKLRDQQITSALSITKSLFKEESKGYKVISKLEKAYQASKIAFALWEKKDTIQMFAIKIAGYIKDTVAFVTGSSAKIAAQSAQNLVQAQGAVASAANAPPPVGFASAAAMIALLAGLGIAISGGGGSAPVIPTNEGTGTVFGDPTAQSESIKKSIELLADNSDVTLPLTAAMLKSLQNIENNIGGLANLLIRNAAGSKLLEGVNVGFTQNSIGKGITKGFDAFNKMTFGLADTLTLGLFSSIGKLIGGLFGKKVSIQGQGLYGGSQKLSNVVGNGFSLYEYVDIRTKKKTMGITTSDKTSTRYDKASQELSNQFTLIFKGFNDAILAAAPMLDRNTNEVAAKLNNFVIKIGKINLQGLNGEQIQEKLNAVFGAEADRMAQAALGGLEDFQKVGEGYFETLIRVANSIEMASVYTDRLNVSAIKYTNILNKQGDVTTEIIRQSVLLNEGNKNIKNGFYDLVNTFNGTAGEITDFVLTLRELQDAVIATGKNGDYLTSAMFAGAGSLDRLQDGLDSYFEMLSPSEQAAELVRRLTREFAEFGEELPSDVKAFRALVSSIDITTEAGQKLYGKIIALAPEFTDLQDALEKVNSEVNQLVKSLRDLAEQARQARGETEQPRNLDYARAMFESTAMLAMQGDTEAAGKLMSLGTNLMNLSKQYSVDGSEYARDLAWIQRAATISADVQEAGLGYTSSTLSTTLSGGSATPTVSTTSTSTDAKLDALREDLNAALLAIAKYTQSTASKLENWDDGNRMMVGVIQEAGDPKVPVTTA